MLEGGECVTRDAAKYGQDAGEPGIMSGASPHGIGFSSLVSTCENYSPLPFSIPGISPSFISRADM